MLYRKIDLETGLFIEDIPLNEQPMIEVDNKLILDESFVSEPIPNGMYVKPSISPKWTGTEWVATAEKPAKEPQEPTEMDYLMLAMVDLDKQRATDKTETELAITELAEIVLGGM